ncbi:MULTISPECIES: HNH endonuclease [Xanthomonas]|uniref:HNH endonuclease n=1 Tax=Xanthomonas TaxID=338 RepID=UPI001ADC381C|nr:MULTISPECIES: HNH endonuclease [unclassified Xanthomonas]MBO9873529.1 HNH endonuclease [Xanthomonas sp. D-93]WNH45311.1 HNH endonuclease [Xanthomonas sp. A6251]
MSNIKNPIVFSANASAKIAGLIGKPEYNHRDWDLQDLQELRHEVRKHYRAEQKMTCAYCRQPVAEISAAGSPIDHIACKSSYLQFMFEPRNLCVTCPDCNSFKRNREVMVDPVLKGSAKKKYPTDTNRFRIFHPHYDNYGDHIKRAGILYFSCSQKGAYTVYICNLARYVNSFGISNELLHDFAAVLQRHQFHEG